MGAAHRSVVIQGLSLFIAALLAQEFSVGVRDRFAQLSAGQDLAAGRIIILILRVNRILGSSSGFGRFFMFDISGRSG